MPFTYSISNGIGAGIISYVVIKLAVGKAREVHPLLYGVAVLFVLYFLRGPLESVVSESRRAGALPCPVTTVIPVNNVVSQAH